jgi:hypothetical protein
MTQVAVKEPSPSLMRRIAGRVLRKRTLVAFAGAVALVLIVHYLLMPWVVRDRVRAALDEAGLRAATFRVTRATLWATDIRNLVLDNANRIDRVEVRYNVHDLWQREVHEIIVTGATFAADPDAWPIEKRQPATTATIAPAIRPKQAGLELPFDRLRIEKSQLVLAGGRKVPVEASLLRTPTERTFRISFPGAGLDAHGTVARSFEGGRIVVDASTVRGDLIGAVLRTYVDDVPVAVAGATSGKVAASWDKDGLRALASLEIAGGSIDEASAAKLTVAAGVFVGEMNVGPTTRPTVTVKADRADFATPDLKAYGVGGAVTLINLSPPTSAPRQKLSAQRLKIGETEFANGQLEFEVTESGDILVRQTRWDFLGGQVYAQDVSVPRDGPVKFTLRAENVELRDILATYAKDKLVGRGKISGELPIVIDGRDIRFGDGQLSAGDGGQLQIKDPATLAQVAEVAGTAAAAAAPVRGGSPQQIKQDIAEALRDFEYDRLTARLTNEPGGGLVGYVNMKGHGRTGARQAIEYDARIRGLDELLRSYLDISGALGGGGDDRAATRATRATRAATGKVEPK